jgi:vitamin B12 transporter
VTVIDSRMLEILNKPDVTEALRLVPGISVIQSGQRGAPASIFVRGGDSDFNKVLIDGIAANDIGGAFDFGQLAITGVDRIEVLRQSNSVLYGSDALSGVISLTSRRGTTRIPELAYQIDGGNLGTFYNTLSLGGAVRRFDYFVQGGRFQTDNDVPNADYRNDTVASRFGVAVGGGTDLSGTLRWLSTDLGNPNGITLYGITDDSRSATEQTYATVAAQSQWSRRWQSVIRFGSVDRRFAFLNPSPSGEAFDPFGFGANYIGDTVTLTAANGQSVTGRAILDFGFSPFPSRFESHTTRRVLTGQASYQASAGLTVSMGARYEREAALDAGGAATATRDSCGVFGEARASLGNRVSITAGVGYERNAAFEDAVTPRLSLVASLRSARAGDTRLVLNAGSGIKAPDVFQQQNSLFGLIAATPTGAVVDPIGPERSRSFDIGVEQGLGGNRARVRLAYFDNDFHDLIEFVNRNVLPQVGVPLADVPASAFGAYVNSQSFRARGIEMSAEAAPVDVLRIRASYTYLDAEVSESFAGGALAPSMNPAFPGVPIGAFSPLVGNRPFRRPTHSGTLFVSYVRGGAQVAMSAYFSGARDDSTFLGGSDQFFGNSLLLPNEDLSPAFQKWDLSAGYQVHPRLRPYVSIENLFDRQYAASFGFPSLPLTARAGVNIRLGGD